MEINSRQMEIIEAAGKILTRAGVGGLTIKNLAKEMEFSESAIYRHFSSKEQIVIAMLDYLADSIDKRLTNATRSHDPEQNFLALFNEQFTFFNNNPHFVVAVFSDGLMEESQLINTSILKLMNVKIKHLMPIIMEGQQKGIFTGAVPAEELVHIIMGTFKLQMFKWQVANFQFDINRAGKNMVHSLLTLIKTNKQI